MSQVLIRSESASDLIAIREINIAAFRDHPISRQTEHLIVDALRTARALDVSLVATCDEQVVGHIAFSKASVGDSARGWMLLGPIAVLPHLQGQGIGTALVEAGLAELRATGASGCVLVGNPEFYGRFGFKTFPGLEYPGVPHQYVLALPFGPSVPSGEIDAHEAFLLEA